MSGRSKIAAILGMAAAVTGLGMGKNDPLSMGISYRPNSMTRFTPVTDKTAKVKAWRAKERRAKKARKLNWN